MARYHYRAHTTYPPASDEQPCSPVYMVFQPIRCTAPDVAIRTGKLLPHLFTLTPSTTLRSGYFLLHYYTLTDIFPLGSMVLCVARTFLSAMWRNDGTACCMAKIRNYLRFEFRLLLMTIFIRIKEVQVAGCRVISTCTMHHAPCNYCPNETYRH